MSEYLPFALSVLTGFFAVMNPIANTPVFIGLMQDYNDAEKKKIAKSACLTAFLIVLVFTLLGKYIFDLFGITIPAFKITGGLLLFFVGFEMLMSMKSKIHEQDTSNTRSDIAISPLAIPILAGPGTIVTAVNFVSGKGFTHILIVLFLFAVMILLTLISFLSADRIMRKLGGNLIKVIGKIMGLILAIIGTGMVTEGIKLSFSL